jgi:hypothetical protein
MVTKPKKKFLQKSFFNVLKPVEVVEKQKLAGKAQPK